MKTDSKSTETKTNNSKGEIEMTKSNAKKDAKEYEAGPLTSKEIERLQEASRATFERAMRDAKEEGWTVKRGVKIVCLSRAISREIATTEIGNRIDAGRGPHAVEVVDLQEGRPARHQRMICSSLTEAIGFANHGLTRNEHEDVCVIGIRPATTEERRIAAGEAASDMSVFLGKHPVK